MNSSPRSQTEYTHHKIRSDILSCHFPPGKKIKIRELCDHYQVSLGAVREALSRLVSEGLVLSEAQKGFQIAPVSLSDLAALTQARIEIECLCLKRAIELGTLEWESNIVGAFHRLIHTPANNEDGNGISSDWEKSHSMYHEALVSACNNAWLLRLRNMLYAQGERYRRLSISLPRPHTRDHIDEHEKLKDAVIRRDYESSTGNITMHLQRTYDVLHEHLLAAGIATT